MSEQSTTTTVTSDFHFRTKDGYKRPTVSVEYPAPNAAGIVEMLQSDDTKLVSMIVESTQNILHNHIRGYVDADLDFDQAKLQELVDAGKINLETIAHIPKADRNTLTKEDLENFAADYIRIMPEVTGKTEAQVATAAGLFVDKFKKVAGDNQVLEILQTQLGLFVDSAPEEVVETHQQVINWAANKLDELLSIKVTADAL